MPVGCWVLACASLLCGAGVSQPFRVGAAAAAQNRLKTAPGRTMRLPALDNDRVRRGAPCSARPHPRGVGAWHAPRTAPRRLPAAAATPQKDLGGCLTGRSVELGTGPRTRGGAGPIRPSDRGRETTPNFCSAPEGSFERPKGLALRGHRDPSVAGR